MIFRRNTILPDETIHSELNFLNWLQNLDEKLYENETVSNDKNSLEIKFVIIFTFLKIINFLTIQSFLKIKLVFF